MEAILAAAHDLVQTKTAWAGTFPVSQRCPGPSIPARHPKRPAHTKQTKKSAKCPLFFHSEPREPSTRSNLWQIANRKFQIPSLGWVLQGVQGTRGLVILPSPRKEEAQIEEPLTFGEKCLAFFPLFLFLGGRHPITGQDSGTLSS